MAEIRPFAGIRPASAYTQRVAALPYDVYSREEAYEEAARDRLSFLNIDRPETQFEPEHDMYAPEVYEKARDLLHLRMNQGIFQQDSQRVYYLYELTMNGRRQTGLVACASIDDYLDGTIKKHENTRADKEADRICHVDVCSVQTGPIFLAYRRNADIAAVTQEVKKTETLFDFVSPDGIRHRGWMISDARKIRKIQEAFGQIGEIYIADGHHRAASAVRVGLRRRWAHPDYSKEEEFNYFLSILFPDDELMIMDYNRVVKDLNGLSKQQFLACVKEKFEIEQCRAIQKEDQANPCKDLLKPAQKGTMLMNLCGTWYRLQVRSAYRSEDPVEGLDVSILQRELLAPVLGIKDPKTDNRIDFVGGIRGYAELERRVQTDCAVAFAMYPTSIGELFHVADAGRLMPPKSTWFEPKLRSGLFLHAIEE